MLLRGRPQGLYEAEMVKLLLSDCMGMSCSGGFSSLGTIAVYVVSSSKVLMSNTYLQPQGVTEVRGS